MRPDESFDMGAMFADCAPLALLDLVSALFQPPPVALLPPTS